MKSYTDVIAAVIDNSAWRATKYLSPKLVVKATQRRWMRQGARLGDWDSADIVFTIGRPNYLERKFIKAAQKAGEPFPIKKIQLKFPPRRRA